MMGILLAGLSFLLFWAVNYGLLSYIMLKENQE